MKILWTIGIAALLAVGCSQASEVSAKATKSVTEAVESVAPDKLLRHVVMFKFKDSATVEQIKEIEEAFVGLSETIDEIHDFEWGTNNSPEGLHKGLTHCFIVTFLSDEDREAYLPHPDHQAFVKLLTPSLDDVTVIDYWTE